MAGKQQNADLKFQMPEEPADGIDTVEPASDAVAPQLNSIDTVPLDGRVILLISADRTKFVEGMWKATRRFKNGKWEKTGLWCGRGGLPLVLDFEPATWELT